MPTTTTTTTTTTTIGLAERYDRDVLPRLVEGLDAVFPAFGFIRDPQGWVATNQDTTHQLLGCRAERVVCHGEVPRGILVHGSGPVLFTTLANGMASARGRDFVRVVSDLAARVGVDLNIDSRPTPAVRRSALLHDVLVLSRRELQSERGSAARDYLVETRGFPTSAIETEAIGVVPAADPLRRALISAGYTAEEITASSVLADDRWAGRLVGAWRDTHGRAQTLWTRSIDRDEPAATRYLYLRGAARTNLPPYGLSDPALHGRGGTHVILVEGLLDAHHLRARGIRNVAALGGTATQTRLFDQLAGQGVEEVTLMLDADQAGHDATCRAIDHAVRAQRCPDLTVVRLDAAVANDPDSYLRDGRVAELVAAIDARRCAIGWRTETLLPKERDRPGTTRAAGEWLGSLPPRWSIEQDHALAVAAALVNADVDATRRAFRARYWTATTPARSATR